MFKRKIPTLNKSSKLLRKRNKVSLHSFLEKKTVNLVGYGELKSL